MDIDGFIYLWNITAETQSTQKQFSDLVKTYTGYQRQWGGGEGGRNRENKGYRTGTGGLAQIE